MVRLNSASLEWSKQSGSQQHTHTHTEKRLSLVVARFQRLGPHPFQTGLTAVSQLHIAKSRLTEKGIFRLEPPVPLTDG